MNIIQIANIMGEGLTFGDLPNSSKIVKDINGITSEEGYTLTTTSTGKDFMAIYNDLDPDVQNVLATVLEDNDRLRLLVVSDIAMFLVSERRKDMETFQQSLRMSLLFVAMIVAIILYTGYRFHVSAKESLGDEYRSSFIETMNSLYDILHPGKALPPETKLNIDEDIK